MAHLGKYCILLASYAGWLLLAACGGRSTKNEDKAHALQQNGSILGGQGAKLASPVKLNVFIQNTPGIDGFAHPGSRFGDNLYGFLNDVCDPNLGLTNSTQGYMLFADSKISDVGGVSALSHKLSSSLAPIRKQKGINTREVDYSELLKTIVDSTTGQQNTVSVLISNMVFRTDEAAPKNMEQYLQRQKQDIRAALQNIGGMALLLLRDTATYKVKEKDKRIHVGYERPYYVLMVGYPETLWGVVKNLDLSARFTHSFWMQKITNPTTLKVQVANDHPWAIGMYDRSREPKAFAHVIDASPGKEGKEFVFVSHADLNSLGPFKALALRPESWQVSPQSASISRIGNAAKGYKLENGYSEFMAIRQPANFTSGDVSITLPYQIPAWVNDLSFKDHTHLRYDSDEARGKSFGLSAIVEGMASVYGIKQQPISQVTFKVSR